MFKECLRNQQGEAMSEQEKAELNLRNGGEARVVDTPYLAPEIGVS